ncbi:Rieske 2Fe-2S domain-containing protein [Alkalilimnicola ehrlichii MLHE-1]|uniref:Rieske (2Fe-2S) domain protein n=1 Tax=Alkalilimnicola ehrlichii (strain ATCC BAA-1101 / DSM 17681 / MLHE-1) TaxID=187272 RepID=Q0A638_ALKEH|nr:aromatic ring-hydroxylating dioxygenase subunit alpha [Alkalilimnicola ehrlichii]ABI57699.1 Rieske (2Fe-2S) domain protein [Alkalilimnicola ehrlichii MLHE-1]
MTPERQETLTRIGPGTTMGELLRRYWWPLAASVEVRPGRALARRLLGEDLVLFRTPAGGLGLIDEHCTHRGASLRCGHVDEEGIACPYHGWKFDHHGHCLAMPAEPRQKPALLRRAATRGFPVQELGGLVFAYIGPDPAPLLPRYDLLLQDDALRDIGVAELPCNWLQIMENSVDPAHVEWLHGHHLAGVRSERGEPAPTQYLKHHQRIGFDVFEYGIIKRRIVAGGSEEDEDWRTGHPLIFPCALRVGTGNQHRFQFRVPMDDTHTRHYWYACYLPPEGRSAPPQREIPLYPVPWRDEHGDYIVDFVDGGDIMVWVSQGAIADRTRERLVASDKGIVLYRRLLLEQAQRVADGLDPMGVIRDEAENRVIRFAQERNKLGDGRRLLREAIEMSHVRYSPLKEQIIALLQP